MMTRLVSTALFVLLALCSTQAEEQSQQRRGLRGNNNNAVDQIRQLEETEGPEATESPLETFAPTEGGSEKPETVAPTIEMTLQDSMEETIADTVALSTFVPTEALSTAVPTEAATESAIKSIEDVKQELQSDENVYDNKSGDGISFEIQSFLDIYFLDSATAYVPNPDEQEVFFDMVDALYTNAIWDSDIGQYFLRYDVDPKTIQATLVPGENLLKYKFTSKVDMRPDAGTNPRLIAYAMADGTDFKEYIERLFAHKIMGVSKVVFRNVGTGY